MPDDLAVTASELEYYKLAPRALEERQFFLEAIGDIVEDGAKAGAKGGAKAGAKGGAKGGARSPSSGAKTMTKGQTKTAKKDNKNTQYITGVSMIGRDLASPELE